MRRDVLPPFPWSIPACAGEPVLFPSRLPSTEVYPRVCGGTTIWTPTESDMEGLSPRVRGNRSLLIAIIPG